MRAPDFEEEFMNRTPAKYSTCLLGAIGVIVSAASVYATETPQVPEINGGTLSTGLAVLAGAILILRSWRR
jgi:hypothetical protein